MGRSKPNRVQNEKWLRQEGEEDNTGESPIKARGWERASDKSNASYSGLACSSTNKSRGSRVADGTRRTAETLKRAVEGRRNAFVAEAQLLLQLRQDLKVLDEVSRPVYRRYKAEDLECFTRALTALKQARRGPCLASVLVVSCQVVDRNLSKFPGMELAAAVALCSVLLLEPSAIGRRDIPPQPSSANIVRKSIPPSLITEATGLSTSPETVPLPAASLEAAAGSLRMLARNLVVEKAKRSLNVCGSGGVVGWEKMDERNTPTGRLARFLTRELNRCRGKTSNSLVEQNINGILAELRGAHFSLSVAAANTIAPPPEFSITADRGDHVDAVSPSSSHDNGAGDSGQRIRGRKAVACEKRGLENVDSKLNAVERSNGVGVVGSLSQTPPPVPPPPPPQALKDHDKKKSRVRKDGATQAPLPEHKQGGNATSRERPGVKDWPPQKGANTVETTGSGLAKAAADSSLTESSATLSGKAVDERSPNSDAPEESECTQVVSKDETGDNTIYSSAPLLNAAGAVEAEVTSLDEGQQPAADTPVPDFADNIGLSQVSGAVDVDTEGGTNPNTDGGIKERREQGRDGERVDSSERSESYGRFEGTRPAAAGTESTGRTGEDGGSRKRKGNDGTKPAFGSAEAERRPQGRLHRPQSEVDDSEGNSFAGETREEYGQDGSPLVMLEENKRLNVCEERWRSREGPAKNGMDGDTTGGGSEEIGFNSSRSELGSMGRNGRRRRREEGGASRGVGSDERVTVTGWVSASRSRRAPLSAPSRSPSELFESSAQLSAAIPSMPSVPRSSLEDCCDLEEEAKEKKKESAVRGADNEHSRNLCLDSVGADSQDSCCGRCRDPLTHRYREFSTHRAPDRSRSSSNSWCCSSMLLSSQSSSALSSSSRHSYTIEKGAISTSGRDVRTHGRVRNKRTRSDASADSRGTRNSCSYVARRRRGGGRESYSPRGEQELSPDTRDSRYRCHRQDIRRRAERARGYEGLGRRNGSRKHGRGRQHEERGACGLTDGDGRSGGPCDNGDKPRMPEESNASASSSSYDVGLDADGGHGRCRDEMNSQEGAGGGRNGDYSEKNYDGARRGGDKSASDDDSCRGGHDVECKDDNSRRDAPCAGSDVGTYGRGARGSDQRWSGGRSSSHSRDNGELVLAAGHVKPGSGRDAQDREYCNSGDREEGGHSRGHGGGKHDSGGDGVGKREGLLFDICRIPLSATATPVLYVTNLTADTTEADIYNLFLPDPEIPDAVILETVGVGGTTGRGLGSDSGDEAAGAGKDHSADPASRDGMEERKAIAVVSFGSASLAAEAKDRLDKYEPHRTSPRSGRGGHMHEGENAAAMSVRFCVGVNRGCVGIGLRDSGSRLVFDQLAEYAMENWHPETILRPKYICRDILSTRHLERVHVTFPSCKEASCAIDLLRREAPRQGSDAGIGCMGGLEVLVLFSRPVTSDGEPAVVVRDLLERREREHADGRGGGEKQGGSGYCSGEEVGSPSQRSTSSRATSACVVSKGAAGAVGSNSSWVEIRAEFGGIDGNGDAFASGRHSHGARKRERDAANESSERGQSPAPKRERSSSSGGGPECEDDVGKGCRDLPEPWRNFQNNSVTVDCRLRAGGGSSVARPASVSSIQSGSMSMDGSSAQRHLGGGIACRVDNRGGVDPVRDLGHSHAMSSNGAGVAMLLASGHDDSRVGCSNAQNSVRRPDGTVASGGVTLPTAPSNRQRQGVLETPGCTDPMGKLDRKSVRKWIREQAAEPERQSACNAPNAKGSGEGWEATQKQVARVATGQAAPEVQGSRAEMEESAVATISTLTATDTADAVVTLPIPDVGAQEVGVNADKDTKQPVKAANVVGAKSVARADASAIQGGATVPDAVEHCSATVDAVVTRDTSIIKIDIGNCADEAPVTPRPDPLPQRHSSPPVNAEMASIPRMNITATGEATSPASQVSASPQTTPTVLTVSAATMIAISSASGACLPDASPHQAAVTEHAATAACASIDAQPMSASPSPARATRTFLSNAQAPNDPRIVGTGVAAGESRETCPTTVTLSRNAPVPLPTPAAPSLDVSPPCADLVPPIDVGLGGYLMDQSLAFAPAGGLPPVGIRPDNGSCQPAQTSEWCLSTPVHERTMPVDNLPALPIGGSSNGGSSTPNSLVADGISEHQSTARVPGPSDLSRGSTAAEASLGGACKQPSEYSMPSLGALMAVALGPGSDPGRRLPTKGGLAQASGFGFGDEMVCGDLTQRQARGLSPVVVGPSSDCVAGVSGFCLAPVGIENQPPTLTTVERSVSVSSDSSVPPDEAGVYTIAGTGAGDEAGQSTPPTGELSPDRRERLPAAVFAAPQTASEAERFMTAGAADQSAVGLGYGGSGGGGFAEKSSLRRGWSSFSEQAEIPLHRWPSPNPSLLSCSSAGKVEKGSQDVMSPVSHAGSTASASTGNSFNFRCDGTGSEVTAKMRTDVDAALKNDARSLRILEVDSDEARCQVLAGCEVVCSFRRESVVAVDMEESLVLKSRTGGRPVKTLLKPSGFKAGTYVSPQIAPSSLPLQPALAASQAASHTRPLVTCSQPPSTAPQKSVVRSYDYDTEMPSQPHIAAPMLFRLPISAPFKLLAPPPEPAVVWQEGARTGAAAVAAAAAAVAKEVAAATAIATPPRYSRMGVTEPTRTGGGTGGGSGGGFVVGTSSLPRCHPRRPISPNTVHRGDLSSDCAGSALRQRRQEWAAANRGGWGGRVVIGQGSAAEGSAAPMAGRGRFAAGSLEPVVPSPGCRQNLELQSLKQLQDNQVAALRQQQVKLCQRHVRQHQALLNQQRQEEQMYLQRTPAHQHRDMLRQLRQQQDGQRRTQQQAFQQQQETLLKELQRRLHTWTQNILSSASSGVHYPRASPVGVSATTLQQPIAATQTAAVRPPHAVESRHQSDGHFSAHPVTRYASNATHTAAVSPAPPEAASPPRPPCVGASDPDSIHNVIAKAAGNRNAALVFRHLDGVKRTVSSSTHKDDSVGAGSRENGSIGIGQASVMYQATGGVGSSAQPATPELLLSSSALAIDTGAIDSGAKSRGQTSTHSRKWRNAAVNTALSSRPWASVGVTVPRNASPAADETVAAPLVDFRMPVAWSNYSSSRIACEKNIVDSRQEIRSRVTSGVGDGLLISQLGDVEELSLSHPHQPNGNRDGPKGGPNHTSRLAAAPAGMQTKNLDLPDGNFQQYQLGLYRQRHQMPQAMQRYHQTWQQQRRHQQQHQEQRRTNSGEEPSPSPLAPPVSYTGDKNPAMLNQNTQQPHNIVGEDGGQGGNRGAVNASTQAGGTGVATACRDSGESCKASTSRGVLFG